jgi:splicing factor 3B subunit 1
LGPEKCVVRTGFTELTRSAVALDRRNYKQVVETTVELAQKAGVTEIVGRIVPGLKDDSEAYRKMVMETMAKVISDLGASDIDERLELQLIDGIIYAFQEQTQEDTVMLDGFGTIVNALGRCQQHQHHDLMFMFAYRRSCQAVSDPDRVDHPLAAQQQERQGPAASGGSDQQAGSGHQAVRRGQLAVQAGCRPLRAAGRGVSGYAWKVGFPSCRRPSLISCSIIAAEAAIANVVGMTQMSPPVKDLCTRTFASLPGY